MEPNKAKSDLNWLIAAGVVGADIGTSVFYGTGILFPIVGYFAPLFVLTACFCMWIFKRTYEEGLAMSPYNGGAYSMILRSVGKRVAVFAGALTFVSYLATASVSSLAGAFYFSSLFENSLEQDQVVWISFIPVIFFALLNIKGIKEPAKLVTWIAIAHFFLLGIICLWGLIYVAFHWNSIDFYKFADFSSYPRELTGSTLAYGFAAAFLGITGFESAAQIVESLKTPTLKTVRKLYKAVILTVSLTAPMISLLCLLILTPQEVNTNVNYLLSGLGSKIGGWFLLNLVVIDATLTLFAATNTAFIGFIGLATTMAKHGNLPQVYLKRIAHILPGVEGYPVTALSLMGIVMIMSALVAGELSIATKVYEMAFLGVMVSFSVGTILMRNRGYRKATPTRYLSKSCLQLNGVKISLPPLLTSLILSFAILFLTLKSSPDVRFMLTFLIGATLILMAYYRWGVLENRLRTHTDLRLGMGKYIQMEKLPEDLPKYLLCLGEHRIRRLIVQTINFISEKKESGPFELVCFHAEQEDEGSSTNEYHELLQRVVSQQIAPIYQSQDFILTVRILPAKLSEGLQNLKNSISPRSIYFGMGRDLDHSSVKAREALSKELEMPIESIS